MKPTRLLALASLALAAACGGTLDANASATPDSLAANAPTFDHVSVQVDDSDAVAAPIAAPGAQADAAAVAAPESCHPHLFVRTHEIVERLNRHTWKHLRHVAALIAKSGKLTAGGTATWEDVQGGIDRKLTISESADGTTFTFELDLGPATPTPVVFTKVFSGTLTRSTSGTATTTDAQMTFDFTALHSVIASEKATGQIAAQVTLVKDTSKPAPGVKKTLALTLTNFLPEEGDPHGPRSGSFTHVGEPGIGGSLAFQDSLVLLCPANPSSKLSDMTTVSRWYKTTQGAISGRADTMATGGQIPAGDKWEGVSCYAGVRGEAVGDLRENAYWMMKLEDASGNTVSGSAVEAGSAAPCDPVFGAVPSLTNNATDFDFSKATAGFPNEW